MSYPDYYSNDIATAAILAREADPGWPEDRDRDDSGAIPGAEPAPVTASDFLRGILPADTPDLPF